MTAFGDRYPYPQERQFLCHFKTKRGDFKLTLIDELWLQTVIHYNVSTTDFIVLIVPIVKMFTNKKYWLFQGLSDCFRFLMGIFAETGKKHTILWGEWYPYSAPNIAKWGPWIFCITQPFSFRNKEISDLSMALLLYCLQ